jgi:hypothetical protein
MGGMPKPSGAREVSRALEEHNLRRELMAHFRKDRGYRTIVACDLRPLLRDISAGGPIPAGTWTVAWGLRSSSPSLYEHLVARLPELFDLPGAKEFLERTDVSGYFDALGRAAGHFRLLQRRRPADWALRMIHADCLAAPGEEPRDDALRSLWHLFRIERVLTLRVEAHVGHAVVWQTLEDPAPVMLRTPDFVEGRDVGLVLGERTSPADADVPYLYWDELDREIDRQVACLKESLRAAMHPADLPHPTRTRYARSSAQRPYYVELLFRLLHPDIVEAQAHDQLIRKHLKELSRRMGLDLPPARPPRTRDRRKKAARKSL